MTWGTHVQKGTGEYALHGGCQVCISANDRAVLPAKLHQTGLQILSTCPSDLTTHCRAAGEVDFAHGGVLDHGVDHLRCILRTTGQNIETASR